MRRSYRLLLLGLFLLPSLACGWVYQPAPRKTPVPIPVDIEELVIHAKDLPRLSNGLSWNSDIFDERKHWEYAMPIDGITGFYEDDGAGRIEVQQLLLRFQDANEAYRFWEYYKENGIVDGMSEYRTDRTPLLSMAELPPLHADRVYLVCDQYWADLEPDCAARLQYVMFFVDLKTSVGPDTFTPNQFYEIVGLVDEAMRPIWENWPIPTLESPLPTSTTESLSPVSPLPTATDVH